MKRFVSIGMVAALVIAFAVAAAGCSCIGGNKIGPTPQPKTATPTVTETATPTPEPARPRPSQAEYDETRGTIQNSILTYATAHAGSYPPKVGDINIDGETRSIIDLCALLESSGGTLTQLPKWVTSVDGDNNDNCDLGGCGCDPEGIYVWAFDGGGNVSSACVGPDCIAHNSDGYQNIYAPQLLSPTVGVTVSDSTPLFTWEAVARATSYQIRVATDPDFNDDDIVINEVLGDVQSYESISALADGVYYWTVRGINTDAGVESPWGVHWYFNMDSSSATVTATPSVSIECISELEYQTRRNEFQNAVVAYMADHSGSLPPTTGEIVIDGTTRYIFDICSLLQLYGGILLAIPDSVASIEGAGNDNCDSGNCSCSSTGQYIWAVDTEANVYSACIGEECMAHNADGYQGACPTPTPLPATLPDSVKLTMEYSATNGDSGEVHWWHEGSITMGEGVTGKWHADESAIQGGVETQKVSIFDSQFGYQYLPDLNQVYKYSDLDYMSTDADMCSIFYAYYVPGLSESEIIDYIHSWPGAEALDISVTGPEDIDGQSCTKFSWIIDEVVYNYWISDSGLLVKHEETAGGEGFYIRYSNVELGVDIDDNIFDINIVAPGVPITEM